MCIRKQALFLYSRVRGHRYVDDYHEGLRLDALGEYEKPMRKNLLRILRHCRESVPYYRRLLQGVRPGCSDSQEYLARLPLLTKPLIRTHFDELKSADLDRRKCQLNTSGGSTGEPIRFIQDWEYRERSRAVTMMFSKWAGKESGDLEIRVWGSERDVFEGTEGLFAKLRNFGTNTRILNAFRMSPEKMRDYIRIINESEPKLIVAYAQAIYELARFAESNAIRVLPQRAILTSAGTLYEFMREKIESVFQTRVFNRYGSREVGDMACECARHEHLHIAPSGHFIEIVDDSGAALPDGVEGNIAVTCLMNYAMPMIRYLIGDRGVMSPVRQCSCGRRGPMLKAVLGRNVDAFKTADGTLIDGEYFTHLLYFRNWVQQFQVIQHAYSEVEFKIVGSRESARPAEIEEIIANTKLVLGASCKVRLDFVPDILPSASGKYRYTISEVSYPI